MRADVYALDSALRERQQWVVPVYQRHYEWETGEDKQLPKLWDDLRDEALERLEGTTPFPHYFGAEPQNQPFGSVVKRYLVDGQQRITTFQLVLVAIREVARSRGVSRLVDVINSYLFNEIGAAMLDAGREQFKLWPSSYDRKLFQNIASSSPEELRSLERSHYFQNGRLRGGSPNLLKAFHFLFDEISSFVEERTKDEEESADQIIDAVLAGFLQGFELVIIQLGVNDDAQEIFASLNGLGKPLTPFDLIRNDVFHRARRTGEDAETV